MKPLHFRECRPARWFAGLALLAVATAGPRLAAADAAIVLDQAAVDTAPVLISRASAMPPLASRPPFGAELVVEFVVDAQGQPRDVKVVEAKATLASGRIFDEADLATIRRLGDLDGISPNASFKDVIDQITQPFLEPGRAAVLGWRYRPGNKAGAAVATRLRATVSVPGADSLPAPSLRTVRTVPAPTPIEPSARSPESDRPSAPPGPSPSTLAIAGAISGNSTITTPGQPQTSIVTAVGADRIVYTPGQPQTTVVAIPSGGSTIYTPGQQPSTVVRVSGTESIIYTPGQPQSTVVSNPGGGSTIYTPGQPPTMVVPIAGGGSMIFAPGQPPVTIQANP